MTKHRYTDEHDKWLYEHIEKCGSYAHLTKMFNEEFGVTVGKYSISDRCIKQLHIHRNANSGLFRKGKHSGREYKIGDERVFCGYVWVKVNDIRHSGKVTSKMFSKNWVQKQRYVYEQHFGKIPDGHIVVFLDGDHMNFNPENLYCISRKINCVMNKNRWFTDNPVNTLTAIKWCELFYTLKEAEK